MLVKGAVAAVAARYADRSQCRSPPQAIVARAESERYFGDSLLAERFVEQPRHIEVQVFGDAHGQVIHLGERECSIQRRFQKLIEESPAPALAPELRQRICDAAVRLASAAGYVNAGTVESSSRPRESSRTSR